MQSRVPIVPIVPIGILFDSSGVDTPGNPLAYHASGAKKQPAAAMAPIPIRNNPDLRFG